MAITYNRNPYVGVDSKWYDSEQHYIAARDREEEMQKQAMVQMQGETAAQQWSLQQAKEAWDLQKKQADASGKIAAQFLESWGGAMKDVAAMFGNATKALNAIMSGETGGSAQLGRLNELADLAKQEYTSFKQEYAPMEKEFMGYARDAAQQKAAIQRSIATGEGFADVEGAASRAGKDVSLQSEIRNQALARELMSMGIDPSSGRFGALTRKGAVETAGETARAMNLARQMEKDKGLDRAISAAGAISPGEYANIGMGIRSQGTQLLGQAGALEKAGVDAEVAKTQAMSNIAGAYGNLASGYSQAISQPLSQMAGYFTGLSGGNVGAINAPNIQPANFNTMQR